MAINSDEDALIVMWTANTGYHLLRSRWKSYKGQTVVWNSVITGFCTEARGSSYEVKCNVRREGQIKRACWLCSGPPLLPLHPPCWAARHLPPEYSRTEETKVDLAKAGWKPMVESFVLIPWRRAIFPFCKLRVWLFFFKGSDVRSQHL